MSLSIPSYADISSVVRSLPVENVYSNIMELLAIHSIEKSLGYLVVYIHKTGEDLSREILALANHSSSLKLSVRVAKRLMKLNDDYLSHSLDHSSNSGSHTSNNDMDPYITHLRKYVSDTADKLNLTGFNAVLVDDKGVPYYYAYNVPSAVPSANLGLDCLKSSFVNGTRKSSDNLIPPNDNPRSDDEPNNSDDDNPDGDDGVGDVLELLFQ